MLHGDPGGYGKNVWIWGSCVCVRDVFYMWLVIERDPQSSQVLRARYDWYG
jgi:hypothetical protein